MKFEIGDKVKYIGVWQTHNSIGTIVGIEKEINCPYEVVFSKPNNQSFLNNTWWCVERNLIKVSLKNQQLLFKFME